MAFTDESDVFGSVHEDGINLVVRHLMRQRPSLFNYATKTPGGFVDFDFFRVSNQLSGTNEPATLQNAANKSKL